MRAVNLKISEMLLLLEQYLNQGYEFCDIRVINTTQSPNQIGVTPSNGNSKPEKPINLISAPKPITDINDIPIAT